MFQLSLTARCKFNVADCVRYLYCYVASFCASSLKIQNSNAKNLCFRRQCVIVRFALTAEEAVYRRGL